MRTDRQLGDKIGPKLAQLVAQSVIATRRGLAPHEAKVTAAALRELVDHMGAEHARFIAPLTDDLLARGELPPELAETIGRAASGHYQWEGRALAGIIGGEASSALGTVLSNYLFPTVAYLVEQRPNLPPDTGTLAQLAARGLIPASDAELYGRRQGLAADWMAAMIQANRSWPGLAELLQLLNRGVITGGELELILSLQGVEPGVRGWLQHLARQLLSPADAALGVLRGDLDHEHGLAIAERNGISPDDFGVLLLNTGEPPGAQQLGEALRRGLIDTARFTRGIRQSRIRDEWVGLLEQLRYQPVATADGIDAWVRGRIDLELARVIAEHNGVEPGQVDILLANAGNPPGDVQLLELWRRGEIDEAQVDRGLRFGRLRDEYIPWLKRLRYDPLGAADVADAWLRGHIDAERARRKMERAGLDPADVDLALANAGNPLGLDELRDGLRRGLIDEAQFTRGFRESRYRDEWRELALHLAYSPPSTPEAIQALVQNHLTADQARSIARDNGLDMRWFDALWQTYGEPLSRTELEQLYNRGRIGLDVVRQGLRESRLKDKYVDDAIALHTRIIEPREALMALEHGAATAEQVTKWLADVGFDHETITVLITMAMTRATGPHRELMTGEITRLYADRIIGRPKAAELLGHLHYSAEASGDLLALADYQLHKRILDSGITAIRTHYLAGRITDVVAAGDLQALGLPPSASDTYMRVWRIDKLAHPRQLTEAQIVKAHAKGLFTPPGLAGTDAGAQANDDIALARLVALGYDQSDSELLLAGA